MGVTPPYSFYIWTRADVDAGHPDPYWFDIGPLGIVGTQGPPGPQGEKGATGSNVKWLVQSYEPTTPDTGSGAQAKQNDMWLSTNPSTLGNVYILTWFNADPDYYEWKPVANIRGPQGIQGRQGIQGEPGKDGADGEPGPQGPRGDTGGLVNIAGIVSNVDQLPTPEQLQNTTIAYLVGTENPRDLYIQIGDDPATAYWFNSGAMNAATLVMVNGQGQNVWDADTKVDKINNPNGYFIYCMLNGVDSYRRFSAYATPSDIVQRDASANIALPNQLNSTLAGDRAVSKAYADANYYPTATGAGVYRVCAYNSSNQPIALRYSNKADTPSSIAQRTPDNRLKAASPAETDDCVNKGYSDAHYAKVLAPDATAGWRVIGFKPDGEQFSNRIATSLTPGKDALVLRDAETQTFHIGEPIEGSHPATKKYVDDHTGGNLNVYAHTISYSGYCYDEYDPAAHRSSGGSFTLYLTKNAALTNAQIWKILEQRIGQVLPYIDGNDHRNIVPLNMVNSSIATIGFGQSTEPDTYFHIESISDDVSPL